MKKLIFLFMKLILLLLTFSAVFVETAQSAYIPDGSGFPLCSGIAISSPENTTYTCDSLTLSASLRGMLSPQFYTYKLEYSLDGECNVTIPVISTFVPVMATITYANGTVTTGPSMFASYYLISGIVDLPVLSKGVHNLTVYGRYDRINDVNTNWPKLLLDKSAVYFTVNAQSTSSMLADPTETHNSTTHVSPGSNDTDLVFDHSETKINKSERVPWPEMAFLVLASAGIAGLAMAVLVIFAKLSSKLSNLHNRILSAYTFSDLATISAKFSSWERSNGRTI